MPALTAVSRRCDVDAFEERARDSLDRRRLQPRHVRERHDPPAGFTRGRDAVRERMPHAVDRIGAVRHLAAFLLEDVGEREIAGADHRDHVESGCDEIARGVRGNGDAVVERVHELAAAEAGAGAGGEQDRDYRLLSVHGSSDYSGRLIRPAYEQRFSRRRSHDYSLAMVPIHDITTDTDDPPQFVALYALRQKSFNGPEYAGDKIARIQKAAYPDIAPRVLDEPSARAFERAHAAARAMGWHIAAAVPDEGRIEATATTPLLRFKDDVVIRVRPEGSGARIDVRSKSRLGRSDLGANAKRIRKYFQTLEAAR